MDILVNIINFFTLIIIALLFKNFLPKYFEQKAKNLANKEDIKGITGEVESIKTSLQSQLYIHQKRYEKEFEILLSLSERLVHLRDSALRLRPVVDFIDSEKEEIKNRRLKAYQEAAMNSYELCETCKPFMPEEIYKAVKILDNIVWREVVQYKNRSFREGAGFDVEYWDKAAKNAGEISKATDDVIELIRNRVKYWEKLTLGGGK